MFANKRQAGIYEIIQKEGAVTTSKLFKQFDVSMETIRRDLLAMEQQGKLTRVHGGAVSRGDIKPFLPLQERKKAFGEQKRELALKAAEFINEGDIIAVDAGSTPTFFAEVLKEKFSSLTVVTHSLDVFNMLCDHEDFSMILCAGHYQKREHSFYGAFAVDTLKQLHVQKVFIFPSAVSLENGISDYQREYYQLQRQLFKCADEVFVLADSSKFEKKALLKLDDMNSDYYYITDSGLPKGLIELYKENGIKLYMGEKTVNSYTEKL